MAKNRTLFLTDYCLTPHVHIPNAGILCEEKKIIAVGGASAFSLDEPGLHVIDLTDAYATPGFIDSHIHGGGGYDTAKALEPDADINILCRHLATHGITTFLPTLMSYPRDKMIALTAKLAELVEDSYEGADPCAINLEGVRSRRPRREIARPAREIPPRAPSASDRPVRWRRPPRYKAPPAPLRPRRVPAPAACGR